MSEHSPVAKHEEADTYSAQESSQEPNAGEFDISLSLPGTIEVRMVDASTLSDYEIWFFSSSALLTFVSGFLVAWTQETDLKAGKVLGIATGIFALFFVGCLIMTFVKRHTMRKKGRTIRLRTSRVGEMKTQ